MQSHDELRQRVAGQIAAGVESRLGRDDPEIQRVIAQEVELTLGDRPFDLALMEAARQRSETAAERIVITSTGRNRSGIVARLAGVIDEFSGDIREISQTIVGDYFTVIFVVDISGATSQGTRFATLRERLHEAGVQLGIHVVVLHDDILSSMHTV